VTDGQTGRITMTLDCYIALAKLQLLVQSQIY